MEVNESLPRRVQPGNCEMAMNECEYAHAHVRGDRLKPNERGVAIIE